MKRDRIVTLCADSSTSKAEALDRLADFVRRQGRPPTAEPTVDFYPPRLSGRVHDLRDLPCWYASQRTAEVPSEPSPFPRITIISWRRLAWYVFLASFSIYAFNGLVYEGETQVRAGSTSSPVIFEGQP